VIHPGRALGGAGVLLVTLVAPAAASPRPAPEGAKIFAKVIDLAELTAEVAGLRGLTVEGPVIAHPAKRLGNPEIPDPEEDEEDAAVEPDAYDLALTALGILGEGETLQGPAAATDTLGTFDGQTDVIEIDSALPTAIGDVTAAHEIVHLLQDEEFGLDEVYSAAADSDAYLAVEALVEGDADFTAYGWSAAAQTPGEQADVKGTRYPDVFVPGDYGAFLDDLLAFPYVAGPGFVAALHQAGGYPAVDAAFRDLPTTTEQVLHPDKYLDREEAERVAGPDSPGGGWFPELRKEAFGEFDVGQLFLPLGPEEATDIAAGWGGGQMDIYMRRDEVAVAITLAFDSRADAAEACQAVPEWWTSLDGARPREEHTAVKGPDRYLAFGCTGDELRIGVAPQAALAEHFSRS